MDFQVHHQIYNLPILSARLNFPFFQTLLERRNLSCHVWCWHWSVSMITWQSFCPVNLTASYHSSNSEHSGDVSVTFVSLMVPSQSLISHLSPVSICLPPNNMFLLVFDTWCNFFFSTFKVNAAWCYFLVVCYCNPWVCLFSFQLNATPPDFTN